MNLTMKFAAAALMVGCMVTPQHLNAQAAAGAAAMTTTQMDPAKALDRMLSGVEKEFVGAAEAMPADKYNFAPSADYFKPGATTEFTGVRTFAQQIAHVTQANYHFYTQFSPTPNPATRVASSLPSSGTGLWLPRPPQAFTWMARGSFSLPDSTPDS